MKRCEGGRIDIAGQTHGFPIPHRRVRQVQRIERMATLRVIERVQKVLHEGRSLRHVMGRIGWHVFIEALAANGRLRSLAGALSGFWKRGLGTFAAFPIETSVAANDGFWCHAVLHFTPGRVTMTSTEHRSLLRSSRAGILAGVIAAPGIVCAQASPFLTGATALQSNILAWLTPIAIILVMVLGAMAMANRMSWGWCLGAIFGIAIAFGAPQIVTWVRGMFGV